MFYIVQYSISYKQTYLSPFSINDSKERLGSVTTHPFLDRTTPMGVASLIAKAIASVDDVAESFSKLGMFVVVVTVGVLVHQLVVLSLLLFALTRRNPLTFHLSILRPYFIAFAATST